MARRTKKPKPKTAVELARSAGSAVAVAAFSRSGAGTHGKRGAGRSKQDNRSRAEVRRDLRRGDE